MKEFRFIISGGGTGGHIFPAISIANELRERFPEAEILFVGAIGKMEMEKVPAAGYKIEGLPVSGFPRKPGMAYFKFARNLFMSSIKARRIIKSFKPSIAIGVGGFASGPVLRAAARKSIPTLIQEQNSYAGITNKLLSKKAKSICVAYENMERFFPSDKIVLTGNPVRQNLISNKDIKKEALGYFQLDGKQKVLLIIGGSLGARSINDAVVQNIELISNSGVQVIWQTGAFYFDEMNRRLEGKKPDNLHIHKFISKMEFAYSVADLVISRAGASSISELCLVGKPSILVPSPNVAEDHQTKNANALVEKQAAILLKDNTINDQLFTKAFEVIENEDEMKSLAKNIKQLAKPDATKNIVNEIIGLI